VYDRFDLATEPNEPFRFGWVVEVDPQHPSSTPRKRTALGRLKHENATVSLANDNRVVVYTGDDERFDYVYKFVTSGTWQQGQPGGDLLDDGTLYVARFNEDGTGEWLPLVHGEGPLTAENGFNSQAEVLINTRGAADLLEPTKMDRPEDIERSPETGKLYLVMTNNTNRGVDDGFGTDAANPRWANRYGHIIELTEDGNDAGSTTFAWDIFLLAGDPTDPSTDFGGFDKASIVSPISNPDNLVFDGNANLWIVTDGQPGTIERNDAMFAVAVEGDQRGNILPFLSVPAAAECTGPAFTPDFQTVFVAVQHPGEGGTFAEPLSRWPDYDDAMPPRPGVVAVWRTAGDGAPIGT
jgi:secreted PhoX family phosphatase